MNSEGEVNTDAIMGALGLLRGPKFRERSRRKLDDMKKKKKEKGQRL